MGCHCSRQADENRVGRLVAPRSIATITATVTDAKYSEEVPRETKRPTVVAIVSMSTGTIREHSTPPVEEPATNNIIRHKRVQDFKGGVGTAARSHRHQTPLNRQIYSIRDHALPITPPSPIGASLVSVVSAIIDSKSHSASLSSLPFPPSLSLIPSLPGYFDPLLPPAHLLAPLPPRRSTLATARAVALPTEVNYENTTADPDEEDEEEESDDDEDAEEEKDGDEQKQTNSPMVSRSPTFRPHADSTSLPALVLPLPLSLPSPMLISSSRSPPRSPALRPQPTPLIDLGLNEIPRRSQRAMGILETLTPPGSPFSSSSTSSHPCPPHHLSSVLTSYGRGNDSPVSSLSSTSSPALSTPQAALFTMYSPRGTNARVHPSCSAFHQRIVIVNYNNGSTLPPLALAPSLTTTTDVSTKGNVLASSANK